MTFPAVPRFPVQPILLGVGFALLVAIGTATVWLAEQSAQDARSVVHTINVQEKLSNLLLNVRRAESGQRGFLNRRLEALHLRLVCGSRDQHDLPVSPLR